MLSLLPARLTPLTDLQNRRAKLEAIANANVFFKKAPGRNILAKGTRGVEQGMINRNRAPMGIVIARIVVQSLVRSAMIAEIGLLIALYAQKPDLYRPRDRIFGNCTQFSAREGPSLAREQGQHFDAHHRVALY